MSDQQELRERREALAQAVNSHDKEAILSFIHPSFVGKTKRGFSLAGYQTVVRMAEQLCAPGSDYQETVAIEEIEVSGDSARLLVRRVARARACSQEDRAQETWRLIEGRWLLVEERRRDAIIKTRHILVAVALVLYVGAFVTWNVFPFGESWFYGGTKFQCSGDPALKLEVRRASEKEVDGWKPSISPVNPRRDNHPFYVSPEVALSNEDVLSTRVHFEPIESRRSGKNFFLFWSVACFVLLWWRKDKPWMWSWGVCGGVFLLLGLGTLALELTLTPDRSYQRGIWIVVIRFNDAGTTKLADEIASMRKGLGEPAWGHESNYLAFLIDGELHSQIFVAAGRGHRAQVFLHSRNDSGHVWKDYTEGYLYQVALSEEDATRIAKGIVGP